MLDKLSNHTRAMLLGCEPLLLALPLLLASGCAYPNRPLEPKEFAEAHDRPLSHNWWIYPAGAATLLMTPLIFRWRSKYLVGLSAVAAGVSTLNYLSSLDMNQHIGIRWTQKGTHQINSHLLLLNWGNGGICVTDCYSESNDVVDFLNTPEIELRRYRSGVKVYPRGSDPALNQNQLRPWWIRWGFQFAFWNPPVNQNASFRVLHANTIAAPHWFFITLFSIAPVYSTLSALRRWRRSRKRHCPKCNYDLRASKDRCPECGTPIPQATPHST